MDILDMEQCAFKYFIVESIAPILRCVDTKLSRLKTMVEEFGGL